MNIIAYGGTNSLSGAQNTDVFLDDYQNKTITKQNIIDLLLSEIWDNRDGIILRHTNNVVVEITRDNDNELVDEITSQGFYTIRMACRDTDNNLATIFWENRDVSLETDYINVLVKENQSPVILVYDKHIFNLQDYSGNTLTRNNLNSEMIFKVVDDRDGIITTDMLNFRIFQTGEESSSGTSGTNWFYPSYGGTSGIVFQEVYPPVELLYIDEIGEYEIEIKVQDSDSAVTVAEVIIDAYIW